MHFIFDKQTLFQKIMQWLFQLLKNKGKDLKMNKLLEYTNPKIQMKITLQVTSELS